MNITGRNGVRGDPQGFRGNGILLIDRYTVDCLVQGAIAGWIYASYPDTVLCFAVLRLYDAVKNR